MHHNNSVHDTHRIHGFMVATGQEMVREKFFKVREKSVNFILSQGKLKV